MLPPPRRVTSSEWDAPVGLLSYTTAPVTRFQIRIRIVSGPSLAATEKPKSPAPFNRPLPCRWAVLRDTTNQSSAVLRKSSPPTLSVSSALPLGIEADDDWYRATSSNASLPLTDASAAYAPAGESIQPPPVIQPAEAA